MKSLNSRKSVKQVPSFKSGVTRINSPAWAIRQGRMTTRRRGPSSILDSVISPRVAVIYTKYSPPQFRRLHENPIQLLYFPQNQPGQRHALSEPIRQSAGRLAGCDSSVLRSILFDERVCHSRAIQYSTSGSDNWKPESLSRALFQN